MTRIHACAHVGFSTPLHLYLSLRLQLRSAGAAVIQELFPRVSSIATLDISDNGTVARFNTSRCDLDSLSSGRRCLSGLLMNQAELCWALPLSLYIYIHIFKCVCVLVCVLTGLDADLLTVLPALSRHPSLKHLYLGKNFNIKNRCCRFLLSRFTAAMYLWLYVCVCARVCVCGHEGACTTYASLDIRVCDFTSVLISGCRSSGRNLAGSRKWLAPAHTASSLCLSPRCLSAGFWMKSCRSWFSSYRRRIVWVRNTEMSAFIKRYCKTQS